VDVHIGRLYRKVNGPRDILINQQGPRRGFIIQLPGLIYPQLLPVLDPLTERSTIGRFTQRSLVCTTLYDLVPRRRGLAATQKRGRPSSGTRELDGPRARNRGEKASPISFLEKIQYQQ